MIMRITPSVMSQQIRDNVALGDPVALHHSSAESSKDYMEQAARLVGAQSFIEKLLKGLDTYLSRTVPTTYSGAIEGTRLSNDAQ